MFFWNSTWLKTSVEISGSGLNQRICVPDFAPTRVQGGIQLSLKGLRKRLWLSGCVPSLCEEKGLEKPHWDLKLSWR